MTSLKGFVLRYQATLIRYKGSKSAFIKAE